MEFNLNRKFSHRAELTVCSILKSGSKTSKENASPVPAYSQTSTSTRQQSKKRVVFFGVDSQSTPRPWSKEETPAATCEWCCELPHKHWCHTWNYGDTSRLMGIADWLDEQFVQGHDYMQLSGNRLSMRGLAPGVPLEP
jgi:hypothetical protein